ncbi:hypothetical protein CesoFtcFv8_010922 [Champsocephalus esox]|uniref:Uncharacterized protein n=1 Tax=Champsocephalus esox TaxID=159716 RepID=A0AAN8C340_9TELE|nr:hypothetical protein CesoFtcFv8_010922 [Champsocephalus esox]
MWRRHPWARGQGGRESTERPGWERGTDTETDLILCLWMCSEAAIQYCKHAVHPNPVRHDPQGAERRSSEEFRRVY